MYTLTHNNYNMLAALRINCIIVALSNTKLKKMINVSHHLINDNVYRLSIKKKTYNL